MEESKPEVVACNFGASDNKTVPSCPNCEKTDNVVKIVFGKPSPEMMKQAQDGKVALGGCCPPMDGQKPRSYKCKTCNKEF